MCVEFTFAKLCLGGDKQRLGFCQAGDLRCPSEGLGRLVDAGDIFQGFLVGFFRRRYIYIYIALFIFDLYNSAMFLFGVCAGHRYLHLICSLFEGYAWPEVMKTLSSAATLDDSRVTGRHHGNGRGWRPNAFDVLQVGTTCSGRPTSCEHQSVENNVPNRVLSPCGICLWAT